MATILKIEIPDGEKINLAEVWEKALNHFGAQALPTVELSLEQEHFYPIGEDVLYTNTTLIFTYHNVKKPLI
jgi:hypothetical protein